MDAAIIEKEALNLPDSERAIFSDRLISSLSPVSEDLKEAWIREADSRMEGFRDGEIATLMGLKRWLISRLGLSDELSFFIACLL